uniref:Uncharacterized protein n=1 Tax=Plectus sambesii TaxID=2011161 RepID=A0A914VEW4_9BILA
MDERLGALYEPTTESHHHHWPTNLGCRIGGRLGAGGRSIGQLTPSKPLASMTAAVARGHPAQLHL